MLIVQAMLLEYGETMGTDLQRLRAPLQEPLMSLADLERHMNKFMLSSKKLTATGRGKKTYEYFETFLETVRGFPLVAQTLSTYYAAYYSHAISPPQSPTCIHDGPVNRLPVLGCCYACPCPSAQQEKQKGQKYSPWAKNELGPTRHLAHLGVPPQLFRRHRWTTRGTHNRGCTGSSVPRRDPEAHRAACHHHHHQHCPFTVRCYYR
jgi:hypothetical protein